MKSTVSVILALSLVTPAISAAPQSGVGQPHITPTERALWSHALRELRPGDAIAILVRTDGQIVPLGERYVVGADDAGLTVINLSAAAFSPSTRDALRGTARHHPDLFVAAERGVAVTVNESVSLSADGVFERGRRVAELTQVFERIETPQIAGITGGKSAGNRIGCGLVAWFGGGIAGGMIGLLIGALLSQHSHDSIPAPVAIGLIAGEAAGTAFVWHKCWSTGTKTIYRAP